MQTAKAIAESWLELPEGRITDVEAKSCRFQHSMFAVCNVAMPLVKPMKRNVMYWWTQKMTILRGACWRARGHLSRACRKRRRVAERVARSGLQDGVVSAEACHQGC